VPDSLPITEETRDRLREQANQLQPATVMRLVDLLHVAVEDMRQGGDPRLPLELALVKVTRPAADLSPQSLAYRIELLEQGAPAQPRAEAPEPGSAAAPAEPLPRVSAAPPPSVDLEQIQEAWRRSVLPAVEGRSIPFGKTLAEGHPVALDDDELTVEFPEQAAFHLKLAEDAKNSTLLREALYEVTGRRLVVRFVLGTRGNGHGEPAGDEPVGEDDLIELMKSTFDARELEDR
jgi:DNA polymerase III gamma/tau subunit